MAIQTRFYVEKGPSDKQLQQFVDPSASGVERFRSPIMIVQYDDVVPNIVVTLDNYMDTLGYDNLTGNLSYDVFSRPGNPAAVAGRCRFYALTIGGVTHAFIRDDDGGTYQLSPTQYPTNYVNGAVIAYVSATTVQIGTGTVRSRSDKMNLVLAAPVNVDITIAGAGGLDTGAEAANTWYYVHLIGDSTGVLPTVGLLSTQQNIPTLPAGYDNNRRVGAVRNDAASNFVPFLATGQGPQRSVQFTDAIANRQQLTGGNATIVTQVNCGKYVPNSATFARFQFAQRGTANALIYNDPTQPIGSPQRTILPANSLCDVLPVTSTQRIAYANDAAGGLVDVWVTGYEESL